MTGGGGQNPETNWDEARIALGRVAELFDDNINFSLAELRGLTNYQLIPEPVRQTIEGLSAQERQLVRQTFTTLAQNHFYLENNLGRGLRAGY